LKGRLKNREEGKEEIAQNCNGGGSGGNKKGKGNEDTNQLKGQISEAIVT